MVIGTLSLKDFIFIPRLQNGRMNQAAVKSVTFSCPCLLSFLSAYKPFSYLRSGWGMHPDPLWAWQYTVHLCFQGVRRCSILFGSICISSDLE